MLRIADDEVDAKLDQELRELLAACFTNPGDEVFRTRRFHTRSPAWRWSIRREGRLIAHVAAHDLSIMGGLQPRSRVFRIFGVAEVCVEPASRGAGLVREMLDAAHAFGEARGFDFAMLFGREAIYRSSGYHVMKGRVSVHDSAGSVKARTDVLVRALAGAIPEGTLALDGPAF